MAARLGRPPIDPAKKKQTVGVTLPPAEIKKVAQWAKRHGVTRSQIFYDALRALEGSIQEDMAHLRQELADQKSTVERLQTLHESQSRELSRLKSSQELADAVLSPYRSPDDALTGAEKERARTLRAVMHREESLFLLRQLAQGDRQTPPPLPVFHALAAAWGSWENAWKAAQALQKENPA